MSCQVSTYQFNKLCKICTIRSILEGILIMQIDKWSIVTRAPRSGSAYSRGALYAFLVVLLQHRIQHKTYKKEEPALSGICKGVVMLQQRLVVVLYCIVIILNDTIQYNMQRRPYNRCNSLFLIYVRFDKLPLNVL